MQYMVVKIWLLLESTVYIRIITIYDMLSVIQIDDHGLKALDNISTR